MQPVRAGALQAKLRQYSPVAQSASARQRTQAPDARSQMGAPVLVQSEFAVQAAPTSRQRLERHSSSAAQSRLVVQVAMQQPASQAPASPQSADALQLVRVPQSLGVTVGVTHTLSTQSSG